MITLEANMEVLTEMKEKLGHTDIGDMINRALLLARLMVQHDNCCIINGKRYSMERPHD